MMELKVFHGCYCDDGSLFRCWIYLLLNFKQLVSTKSMVTSVVVEGSVACKSDIGKGVDCKRGLG